MTPEEALAEVRTILQMTDRFGFERRTPTFAAASFVDAVDYESPFLAWTLLDGDIQREILMDAVQRGILADPGITVRAECLPTLDVWPAFGRALIDGARLWLSRARELEHPSWATDPRPVALDTEAVLLLDATRESSRGTCFLMRRSEDGWRIAGIDVPDDVCTGR